MKMVGVAFTKMTFSADFTFLKSKKEGNITWTLKMCMTMLKGQENMRLEMNLQMLETIVNFYGAGGAPLRLEKVTP